ncbi:SWIM zinc finger family protein [Thiocystis violacea]|uniref:SWIM zinc finger family protein n=1 Tax=Thiocystis violacea TaxID=13725 RepID=UPI001907AC2A|nr:DUF6880 family protein [Thiocystis violacea]MBK1718911.1 hypothetical protein [Thiocystis violacea]
MFSDVITIARLENLAGKKVFWRGQDYFASDAVGRVRVIGDRIKARVQGSEVYEVELWEDDGQLGSDCSCPHAADGYFCKHCVAVGLAWLGGAADLPPDAETPETGSRPDPWSAIASHLETQPHDTLVALLLETARRDDRLYQSLLLKAERGRAGTDQAKTFRRAIEAATRGVADWQGADEFAEDLDAVADALEELLEPDSAALLIDLSEYAIERAEAAMQRIEDEEGEGVEVIERLGDLHQQACRLARPDPVEFAERLFRLEVRQDFQFVGFDPATYRETLGEVGLKRYRELVEAQWRELGPRPSQERYDSHRARVTRLMESLANLAGDIEELISIRASDLTAAYRYLDIAELWTKAGQPEQALEWAERGLAAFPDRPDNRLRDFLAAAYLERGRQDEALRLTWIQFEEQPNLTHYQKLKLVADRLGVWPAQRERALAWLEEHIQAEAAKTSQWRPKPSAPNYSPRVEIALWEQDPDAGLEAIARGACDTRLLITLAAQLETPRPDEAIAIYRRLIPSIVDQTSNRAYEDAIRLIRRVGELMRSQDRTVPFREYLEKLRIRYKPKRNFIKLLDTIAQRANR